MSHFYAKIYIYNNKGIKTLNYFIIKSFGFGFGFDETLGFGFGFEPKPKKWFRSFTNQQSAESVEECN